MGMHFWKQSLGQSDEVHWTIPLQPDQTHETHTDKLEPTGQTKDIFLH